MAFSCVNYYLVRHSFALIGRDSPSRNTVKQDIIDCAILVQGYVKRLLEPITFFSLEFDLWTSISKEAILGIIIHFVDNGIRHSMVLDTLPLQDELNHDHVSYASSVRVIIDRYGIVEYFRFICCTTDGARVNRSAAEALGTDYQRCACHLMALMVKDTCEYELIFDMYTMCHNIQCLFSNSCINGAYLKLFGSQRKIQDFCPTRWNDVRNLFVTTKANIQPLELMINDPTVDFVIGELVCDELDIDFPFVKNNIDAVIKVFDLMNDFIIKYSRVDIYIGELYHDFKTLQGTLFAQLEPLSDGEPLDVFYARYTELLDDDFIVASALLNPATECRVLVKNTTSNLLEYKRSHKPDALKALTTIQTLANKYRNDLPEASTQQQQVLWDPSLSSAADAVAIFSQELRGIAN